MRPQTQRAGQPVLLHLTSTASQHSKPFSRAIADSGALCVQAGNVYEALARTLQPRGQDAIDVVLVCLDCVTDPELEFFELVHQCRPELGTYVYTSGADASRAQRLIDHRLASLAVTSDIASVLSTLEADGASDAWRRWEPASPPPTQDTTPREQPSEPRKAGPEAAAAGSRDERRSDVTVEQHEVGKPPTRRPPPASDSDSVEDRPDVLLTQEELAALLGRNSHTNSQEPQP